MIERLVLVKQYGVHVLIVDELFGLCCRIDFFALAKRLYRKVMQCLES